VRFQFLFLFNVTADGSPKWDWLPLMLTVGACPLQFAAVVSLLPKFHIWSLWGPDYAGPHVWIDRTTIQQHVEKYRASQSPATES
jgi:hypothetical protein